MSDDALLQQQARLQAEAREVVERLRLVETLGRGGRVVPLGSAVTGLMVWRDLDFGVDGTDLTSDLAWQTVQPLLGLCSALVYRNDLEGDRHYYVMRIDGWKIDLSLWATGMPSEVEAFQEELLGRLTDPLRLTILRLKRAWSSHPAYPDVVSAWQIYDAVLHHAVETLDELDAYLADRGFPTRGG